MLTELPILRMGKSYEVENMKQKEMIASISLLLLMIAILGIVEAALPTTTTGVSAIVVRNKTMFEVNNVNYQLINQRPDPAEPGGYVEVRLKVENVGASDADQVLFEIMPRFPFTLEPGQEAIINLGKVGARQVGKDAYILYYKLTIDKDAVEGNNEIRFRYSKDSGRRWIEIEPFYVRIQTLDAILAVEDVTLLPSELSPGKIGILNITILNTADSLLKDIKFRLDLDDTSFAVVGSSSEKILLNLDAKEKANVVFNLATQVDAASKVHTLPLTITYIDELGKNYTKTNDLGIMVNDRPQYMLAIDDTEIYTRKSKGKIVVSISNIGTSEIKYLAAEMKPGSDYTILSTPKVYLGNLDSDDFDSAEFLVYVTSKKKKVPLSFDITFKDSFNNGFSETKTIELPLYSSSEAKRYGLGKAGSIIRQLLLVMVLVVLTAFWLFMVMEARKVPMIRYKKILWMLLVIGGYALGAGIFYLMKQKLKK